MNKNKKLFAIATTLIFLALCLPVFVSSQLANAATAIDNQQQPITTTQTTGAITVQQGETYTIPAGTAVTADSLTNNGGNVFVQGELYVKGNLTNQNSGVVISSNKLTVDGPVTNQAGSILRTDSGAISWFNTAVNNSGTIDNFGDLSGSQMALTTNGILNNHGSITGMGITVTVPSGGFYNNSGRHYGSDYSYLIVQAGGVLNNTNTVINAAGNVINDGTINNNNGGQFSIHKQTYGVSTLENHAQATINNSGNILIEGGTNFINSGTLTGNPATIQQQPAQDSDAPKPVVQPAGCPDPTQECPSPP